MIRHVHLVVVATTFALALAGCGSDGTPSGPPTTTDTAPRPSSSGVLSITAPRDGQTVRDSEVEVAIDLEGAHLVDLTSTDVRPDEGHLHVTLDDQLLSMTGELDQTLTDLDPGLHLLKVELVAADHAPFDPRVIAAVAFTVPDR